MPLLLLAGAVGLGVGGFLGFQSGKLLTIVVIGGVAFLVLKKQGVL